MVSPTMVLFPGKKPLQPESSRANKSPAANLVMNENRCTFNILPSERVGVHITVTDVGPLIK